MKNVRWFFFLISIFSATSTSAQYADDDVTIHSNRKAKDPFTVNKKPKLIDSSSSSTTISLPDFNPEEKVQTFINISGIHIINAVSDSSSLGHVQTGLFNRWAEGIPDKPYTEYLQSYIDRRYNPVCTKGAAKLVWIIHELRIGERTFNMSEKSFVHLKAISFAGDSTEPFRQITELDTILVRGGMDVTHKHGDNIAQAYDVLIPIEQKQNSIVLTNYLSLARGNNNAILLGTMGGGLIGGAITGGSSMAGILPLVENIPYIRKKAPLATSIDIETGEFSL